MAQLRKPLWKQIRPGPFRRWRQLVFTTGPEWKPAFPRRPRPPPLPLVASSRPSTITASREEESWSHGGRRVHWPRDWTRWAAQIPPSFQASSTTRSWGCFDSRFVFRFVDWFSSVRLVAGFGVGCGFGVGWGFGGQSLLFRRVRFPFSLKS
jgi:hypothetical protein